MCPRVWVKTEREEQSAINLYLWSHHRPPEGEILYPSVQALRSAPKHQHSRIPDASLRRFPRRNSLFLFTTGPDAHSGVTGCRCSLEIVSRDLVFNTDAANFQQRQIRRHGVASHPFIAPDLLPCAFPDEEYFY